MASSGETRSSVAVTKGKGFSELAVRRGFCKPKHILEALREQNRLNEDEGVQRSLKQILLERGVLSLTQVEEIETGRRGAKILAGFEVLEKVGQGAMGVVFKARQTALDRVVALKVLSPKLARNKSFKERFLREARFSAKLNHLHIINGIDCGEAQGYLYFAMEFVNGRTTGEMLKEQGRLSVEESVRIVRQVADALQYAHSLNLVHRDVKPDNVMVDEQGTAKLCDLGLATLKRAERDDRWGDGDDDRNGDGDGSATKAGRVVGTPLYLSPEQAKGVGCIDCRCDIYALGATFYHYLAGRPPFDGRSRDVMRQHVKDQAPGVCELNANVPVVLGQIVSKMMAKDPEERYADPEKLIADLDAAVDGTKVAAAEFKGKSSCALPGRNVRRPPMPKLNEKSAQKVLSVQKKKSQDTTRRHLPFTPNAPSTRFARNTRMLRRPRQSSSGVIDVVIIALALIIAIVLYSHLSKAPVPPPLPPPPPPLQTAQVNAPGAPETTPAKPERKPVPDDKKDRPAVPVDLKTTDPLDRVVEVADPKKTETTPLVAPVRGQSTVPKVNVLGLLVREVTKRLALGDLGQAHVVMDELAIRPEFSASKAELDAERKDLATARDFELAALRRLASSQPRKMVRLTESGRGKCGGKESVVVESYDPTRGVLGTLGQVGIHLRPSDLSPSDLVRKADGVGDLTGSVCYLLARGYVRSARKRLPQLPPEVRTRLEAKAGWLVEFERESEAAAALK